MTKKEIKQKESIFILKKDNPLNKSFDIVAKDYFNEYVKSSKEKKHESRYS